MAWLRIDDTVPHHQKFLRAGADAAWLWVCAVAYCQRHLSDGFVPSEAVAFLGVPKGAARLMETLCDVRLMERAEGGYRVHDYHDHNATRDEAMARREDISRARSAAGKRGANARWQNGKPDGNAMAVANGNAMAPSHPIPIRTPQPPLAGGRAITRAERKRAEDLRRRAFGCTHEPRCANYEACIVTIVLGLREQAASA